MDSSYASVLLKLVFFGTTKHDHSRKSCNSSALSLSSFRELGARRFVVVAFVS